ncbi:MAG: 7-carboxy-7-deazaguanine synthase [Candidatus Palauibacterales bacterium]|nr:7-carboxy-7-deazaguanine synthase [Candidatus Palauibacterales bacterium]MDP2482846.1 7-carboxy-7-deazaguanine synthase [Candidatus Palauibacterales bacterium]
MAYSVKTIYYTLQGEGANSGRAAVFCRFAGCNLWSGHEEDRQTAICPFCDTDFVGLDGAGGGRFGAATDLVRAIVEAWPGGIERSGTRTRPLVVFTGGEPLLQLDAEVVASLHEAGLEVAVETNGTLDPPPGIDWICVSPKAGAPLVLKTGQELKLVYPQDSAPPEQFADLEFDHFFLQPMDGPRLERNTRLAVRYCLAHPQWRLSLQTHKFIGIE